MSVELGEQPSTPAASTPSAPAPSAPASPDTAPVGQSSPSPATNVPTLEAGDGAAPADPRAEIEQFAQSLGLDPAVLALHPNIDSARAAAVQYIENMARAGITPAHQQYQQYQQPSYQPQATYTPAPQPQAPEPSQLDLSSLGLAEDDPAGKAIRMLEQRLSQVDQTAAAIQQQMQQAQAAQTQAAQMRLLQEAESVVDSFDSPRFGKGANRTIAQKSALYQLYQIADVLQYAAQANRQPVPSVSQRLHQAKLILEQDPAAPSAPAAPAPALSTSAASTTPPAVPGPRLNERWVDNPVIRQRLGL